MPRASNCPSAFLAYPLGLRRDYSEAIVRTVSALSRTNSRHSECETVRIPLKPIAVST